MKISAFFFLPFALFGGGGALVYATWEEDGGQAAWRLGERRGIVHALTEATSLTPVCREFWAGELRQRVRPE